jgi:serine/threonine-protein kinase
MLAQLLAGRASRWLMVATLIGLAGLDLWAYLGVRDYLRASRSAEMRLLTEYAAARLAGGQPLPEVRELSGRLSRMRLFTFDRIGRVVAGSAPPGLPLPMSPLLDQALGAGPGSTHGEVLIPYLDRDGAEVFGAWQWQGDTCIGVELPRAEARVPLAYLGVALGGTFSLLALAVATALGGSISLSALGREMRQFGQYRLLERIEEGGMATVYRAEHALLKRPTAIKVLKPHLATDELVERFSREVRLASRLQHPATVEIYDYGRTAEGTFYFAMEYIDGMTFARLVERDGPQPPARVAYLLKQVCESLREAHHAGLLHRDMKPQNLMLCARGGEYDVVKVVDWGLIKDTRAMEARDITQFARVLGTPVYLPPERIRNPAHADPLVDIYGVGAVAYFLLTGRLLFDAEGEFDLNRMIVDELAPRVSAVTPTVPALLDQLVASCLAKRPAERPQQVEELIAVLDQLLRETPWGEAQARRWWASQPGA